MPSDFQRFRLGTFDCLAVYDGTHPYHDPASVLFVNASEESRDRVCREHKLDRDVWDGQYTCLLVDTGQHRVLVDTGGGELAPTTGRLLQSLRAAGIRPEDVDTVVITHAHPDHLGGNVDAEGKPRFPNAEYVLSRPEWEFWSADPDLAELPLPDGFKEMLRAYARQQLPPIASRLRLVDDGEEIVPGIRAVAAPGHTPGQIAVVVSSEGEQLLYVSDLVLHPIGLEHPAWYAAVDFSPELTKTTRRRLLDWAADERALILAFHFDSPGLGRVERAGEGWHWRSETPFGAVG